MRPYVSHYQGRGSLNKVKEEALFQRFLSLLPDKDYGGFNGKGDYHTFVTTTSSRYDRFADGLHKLLEKPQTRPIALKITEKYAHLLGLKQFAQVVDMVSGDVDLENILDTVYIPDSKQIKYEITGYLRRKIPKNAQVHIEFYEGKKLLNNYRLDSNFTIAPSDIPDMRNGKIIVNVSEGNQKYKLEFIMKRLPLTETEKAKGFKPEDTQFGLYLKPNLVS